MVLMSVPEMKPRRRRAPEGYRTIGELVADGRAARSTLYRCAKTGELPTSECRRRIVVADADYENFLAVRPRSLGADISVAPR
jgi:hypothetical protein